MSYKRFELFSILFLCTVACRSTEAQAPKGAEEKPQPVPANISIVFQQPDVFRCGKSISWKDLENSKGTNDSSVCAAEPYYSVKGTIVGESKAYKVSAVIYVPEARSSWPASGGAFKSIDPSDGTFTANFCIPQRGPEREFWFQLYLKDKSPIGEKCIIKVAEDW